MRRANELFISKNFATKRSEMPGTKHFEVFAALKEDWSMMHEEEKLIYQNMIVEDRARYEKEMRELAQKGYFMR